MMIDAALVLLNTKVITFLMDLGGQGPLEPCVHDGPRLV